MNPRSRGTTAQAVLGRIIAGEPISATEQRPSIPANVDAAVRKALEKLPADRFTSAQEFVRALNDENFRYGEAATGAATHVGPWKQIAIGAITVAALTTLGFGWSLLRPETPPPLARFSSPFEEAQLPTGFMEFTPDGSALVYVGLGESGEAPQLWIRRWADLDATPIRGTEGAATFTLSPDGREVAFVAGFPGPLRVVALEGGPSRTLVERVNTSADWAPDGTVYFQADPPALSGVSAIGGGGEAVDIVTDFLERESIHALLTVLPGGRMGVFQVWYATTGEDAEVWAIDLDTRERRYLTAGNNPALRFDGALAFRNPGRRPHGCPDRPGHSRSYRSLGPGGRGPRDQRPVWRSELCSVGERDADLCGRGRGRWGGRDFPAGLGDALG